MDADVDYPMVTSHTVSVKMCRHPTSLAEITWEADIYSIYVTLPDTVPHMMILKVDQLKPWANPQNQHGWLAQARYLLAA